MKNIDHIDSLFWQQMDHHKEEKAFRTLMDFYHRKDLTKLEKQYINYAIGFFYFSHTRYEESFHYLKESCKYSDEKDPHSREFLALSLHSLSNGYFTISEYDKAEKYALLAESIIPKKQVKFYSDIQSIIGYCAYLKNNLKEALIHYDNALTAIQKEMPCEVPVVHSKKAVVLYKLGEHQEAVKLLEGALQKSKDCKDNERQILVLRSLIDVSKWEKDYKKAYDYLIELYEVDEQLGHNKRDENFDAMEIRYEAKLKEQENQSLKKLNDQKEDYLNQQKRYTIMASVFGGITLVFSLGLFFLFQQRKRLNKQLKNQIEKTDKANATLERTNVLNQRIISTLSHDIKGPLLSLEFLVAELDSDNSTIQVMNQIKRCNEVLDNLLLWSKHEIIGRPNLEVSTSVLPHVNNTITLFNESIREKELTLVSDLSDFSLNIPEDLFKIVFGNILNNAIKYSEKHGEIRIHGDNGKLTISDCGLPIDDLTKEQLFQSRLVSRLGTSNEAGFGIGLYLSNQLLMNYNYQMNLEIDGKWKSFSIVKLG